MTWLEPMKVWWTQLVHQILVQTQLQRQVEYKWNKTENVHETLYTATCTVILGIDFQDHQLCTLYYLTCL